VLQSPFSLPLCSGSAAKERGGEVASREERKGGTEGVVLRAAVKRPPPKPEDVKFPTANCCDSFGIP